VFSVFSTTDDNGCHFATLKFARLSVITTTNERLQRIRPSHKAQSDPLQIHVSLLNKTQKPSAN